MTRIVICLMGAAMMAVVASPVMAVRWIEDPTGFLLGAKEIRVQGSFYDVQFVPYEQGDCYSLFAECHQACEELLARDAWHFSIDCGRRPERNFVFRSAEAAAAASQALLDQVLVDGPSDYDTNPFRVRACPPNEFAFFCFLMTPYAVHLETDQASVRVVVAENYGDAEPGCSGLPFPGDRVVEGDLALHRSVGCQEGHTIYVKWTPADAPGTLACLLMAGMAGMAGGVKRRKRVGSGATFRRQGLLRTEPLPVTIGDAAESGAAPCREYK